MASKVAPAFADLEQMDDQDMADGGIEDDGLNSDGDSSSQEENQSDTGLTENQNRLLYLIKLYTQTSKGEGSTEEWIRKQALLVLIYEGIVAQIFDYDYAPASDLVESSRKYFNISQEGKSDLDFLREEELINGLKISSKNYQPETCFQISEKGEEVAKKVGKADKEAVHELVYAPGSRELLKVEWEGENYELRASSGYHRLSTVTDTEDVSYVSSAYVPQCLRHGGRPTLSNAHRAHECGAGESAIRDELDEVITLNSVSIIVAEYLPFGANRVVQLNNNLGSTERVQGGFFTALVDGKSNDTKYEVPPGLTSVNILDYTLTNHVNFEADIHFPVEAGVVQVETFGVSVNSDGTMFYGMQVEAIMDRIKDNISLDHLSRLLVDVHVDSSKIIDSIVAEYQRSLMDLIFQGDAASRDKVNLIIANEVTPHLTAEEYMDKGEYENEMKQVLGDTRAAFDISEHDTLVFGAHGLLVAGPNSRHHEPLLCSYLQFQSMDIFIQNFFNRLFKLMDDMRAVQSMIEENESDPNAIDVVRLEVAKLCKQLILLEEILGFLQESLKEMVIPPEPPEQAGRSLYDRLEIAQMKDQLQRRTIDLVKNLAGARYEMEMLRDLTNIVTETKMFNLHETTSSNTEKLCSLQQANAQSSRNLDIMLVLMTSSLAFSLLDRITGQWTVVNTDWMRSFFETVIQQRPFAWFTLNLALFISLGFGMIKFSRHLRHKSQGNISLRIKVFQRVDIDSLKRLLMGKSLLISDEQRLYSRNNETVKISWVEGDKKEWGNFAPIVTVEFDEHTSFLLAICISYNRRSAKKNLAFNAEELKEKVEEEFKRAGVYDASGGDLQGNVPGQGDSAPADGAAAA